MALVHLDFSSSSAKSLKPLAAMTSLWSLNVGGSPVESFNPIRNLPLTEFGISVDHPLLKDKKLGMLRSIKSIRRFTLRGASGNQVHYYHSHKQFWDKYDSGDFAKGRF